MLRSIVRYGVIGGLIVGIALSGMTLGIGHDPGSPWSYLYGYLTMLLGLSTIFIAIKQHRDTNLGGVIKFWPALGLGLGISLIAGIFYVIAWEAVLYFGHLDFAGEYAKAMIEAAKTKGLTGDALAKAVAEAEQFKTMYANPLYRITETFIEIFPVGVLVSLVSAGLLRNSRFLAARRNPG